MMNTPIRYIALDFDNVICELNPAFHIVWTIYQKIQNHDVLKQESLRSNWLKELTNATGDGKIHALNTDVLMILKHVAHMPEQDRPLVFVYTNNPSEELVTFVHDWIELILKRNPWTLAFYPQDPRRTAEREFAPGEPGKSLSGMRACLGNPENLTADSILFLDDLLHPIREEIGCQYLHVNPPFHCQDLLLPYLKTFVSAYGKQTLQNYPALSKYFNLEVKRILDSYVQQNTTYFPAMQDLYKEWNGENWQDYYRYLEFGHGQQTAIERVASSLEYYNRVTEFLRRHLDLQ